jgi:hypothetical protein
MVFDAFLSLVRDGGEKVIVSLLSKCVGEMPAPVE